MDDAIIREQLKLFPSTLDFDYHHLKTQAKVQEIIDKLQLDDNDTKKNKQEKIYIYNFISFLFYLLRNFDTALEYCDKSLTDEPNDLTAIVNKCHFLLAKEDFYSAQKVIESLLEIQNRPDFDKNKYYAKAGLAYAYSRAGPWYHEKGATLYKELLQAYPKEYAWKFGLGLTLIRQTHLFISLRENVPRHEGILLSKAARELLDVTQNTEETDKILCGKAWTQLGRILHANKCDNIENMDIPEELKNKEPKYCFERALEICSTEPFILETSGKYYRYFKELEKSEELLRNSIKLHETCFAYHHLALTLKRKVETQKDTKRFMRSVSYPRHTYSMNTHNMQMGCEIPALFSSISLNETSHYDGNQTRKQPQFCIPRVSRTIVQKPPTLEYAEYHDQSAQRPRETDFYISSGDSFQNRQHSRESEYSLPLREPFSASHTYDDYQVLESDTHLALQENENNFPSKYTSEYMTIDSEVSYQYSEPVRYQRPRGRRNTRQRNQAHRGPKRFQASDTYTPSYSNYNLSHNQEYYGNRRITRPGVNRNIRTKGYGQSHNIGSQPQQLYIPREFPTIVQNPPKSPYAEYHYQSPQGPNETHVYFPSGDFIQNQHYSGESEYSWPLGEPFSASHTYDNYQVLEADTQLALQQNDFSSTFTSGYMTMDSEAVYHYSETAGYQGLRRGRNPRQRSRAHIGPSMFQASEINNPSYKSYNESPNPQYKRNIRIAQHRGNMNMRANTHGQRQSSGSYSESPRVSLLERSVDDKTLSKLLTSPMKMKVYPDNETLMEAVELLKKARKISNGMIIKYHLAIIYRMLDKPDEALKTLYEITNQIGSVLTKFGFVNVYEQKGICLLELSNRSTIPDERKRFEENGKMMLFKAIEQQAILIKEEDVFKNVWNSYYTLKHLLQADKGQDSRLAKLHSIMFEHEEAIKLLENLKQNDGTLKIEDYKVMVESYVATENFTEAIVQLKLLECTKDIDKMGQGFFVKTYILGALHSIKDDDLPTVQARFRFAYNIARSSKWQVQHLPVERLSPTAHMQNKQKYTDEEAATYELLIIHKCHHRDNCVSAKRLKDVLIKYTDLTVTINTEDFLGELVYTALQKTMSASENILVLLQDEENAEADICFQYALKNPQKIIVAVDGDGLIPTILDTHNIPVIRLPSGYYTCNGITCKHINDSATRGDYENEIDILNSLFEVLCINKSLKA